MQALLRIVIPAEKREEALDVLQCLKRPAEVSGGCRGCWILENPDVHGSLTYLVRWDKRDQLNEHLRSDRFRNLLPYIEMSVEPPEFEVSSINPVGGLGYLVTVMGSEAN